MKKPKLFIALLRMALGWVFLYWGISAIVHPDWSIAPLIKNAQTFPSFYAAVSGAPFIEYVNYALKGLYTLVGILLIVGMFARLASFVGICILLFLYFPGLVFPYVGNSYYVVDDHIMYALILAYLFIARSGEYFGLGTLFRFSRY